MGLNISKSNSGPHLQGGNLGLQGPLGYADWRSAGVAFVTYFYKSKTGPHLQVAQTSLLKEGLHKSVSRQG